MDWRVTGYATQLFKRSISNPSQRDTTLLIAFYRFEHLNLICDGCPTMPPPNKKSIFKLCEDNCRRSMYILP